MDYVLRRITDEDKKFFLNCNIKSPFGKLGTMYYMIESVKDNVKMLPLGGQGIMKEDGTEWSEMAEYCAIIWNEKCYTIEYYYNKKWSDAKDSKDTYRITYKIKEILWGKCSNEQKGDFLKILKKCFIAYNMKKEESKCEQVCFWDDEVRWR